MKLNIPKLLEDQFKNSSGILISGIGGGYDILGGLPFLYEFQDKNVVLANYSSISEIFCEISTSGPEYTISQNVDVPVYQLGREGVKIVQEGYKRIVEKHNIDTILLVDGGVDSLMRGNEIGYGTILEDVISMIAASKIPNVTKFLSCIGFGTEVEEEVSHYHALENIADLIKSKAFIGSCSLTNNMDCFKFYQEISQVVMERTRKSHIHSRVMPAANGEFGEFKIEGINARVAGVDYYTAFLTPFMPIYWFFDLNLVLENNLLYNSLQDTSTFIDARIRLREFLSSINRKPRKTLSI